MTLPIIVVLKKVSDCHADNIHRAEFKGFCLIFTVFSSGDAMLENSNIGRYNGLLI